MGDNPTWLIAMADRQRELFEDLPERERPRTCPAVTCCRAYLRREARARRATAVVTRAVASSGTETLRQGTPTSAESAGGALAPEIWPIPARCPVTGGRSCYRDPTQVVPAVRFAVGAILRTGMFIAGAVLAVAWSAVITWVRLFCDDRREGRFILLKLRQ